ncbi:hypothetical protein B0H98_1122 [Vreelandella songnenensis]|uniref:Tryptophan synthase subunit beta like protein n=1 Tax=Vreelandella songnenensis TaxID=1176243 RepID=A0A2T0UTY8_9GAMM|nr:tryptophan synthase subunit beta like protein [Halomonas songnenensis]PRY61380.1 hypothetical protein B0H98_1122 [Halomonas songnenensis]
MFYIKRNAQGEIVTLSKEPTHEGSESLASDSPEVLAFLAGQSGSSANFLASDLAFVRVVEDILAVLLEKGIISFTDLPIPAQQKVMERQSLRAKNDVGLLSDDDTI